MVTASTRGASSHYKYASKNTRVIGKIGVKKHGYPKRLAETFKGMLKRCYHEEFKGYPDYGGRGITVCDEWLENRLRFFEWAIATGYSDKLFIDRIDNNSGYSPSNCRWVTCEINNNNKGSHVYVTYKGETLNIAQWEKKIGCSPNAIRNRLLNGWPSDLAIEAPFDGKWHSSKTKPKKENRGVMGYGLAKLDEEKVKDIKLRLSRGESRLAIANRYDVGRPAIDKIANGQRWAWVTI